MNIRQHIPNLFTIGNLVCGSIAIIFIVRDGFETWAVLLIGLAAILDVFDGAIARALGVSSPIGKELDSLADVVSFGLAPSVIAFSMLERTLPESLQFLKFIAFLNVACAALRLARFNISTDQSNDFRGMPSPANGIFWAGLAAAQWQHSQLSGYTGRFAHATELSIEVMILVVIISLLMVSAIRMFSFKFKKGGFNENKIPYIFIITVIPIAFIAMFSHGAFFIAAPYGIGWYIILSLVYHFSLKKQAV